MGILGVLSYGFSFAGTTAFFLFSLYAFQTNRSHERNASYYRGRMGFYTMMHTIAGLAQLMLAIYIMSKFDKSKLEKGPIGVAMFVVTFPLMSFYVGLLQTMNGVWGMLRSKGYGFFKADKKEDSSYTLSVMSSWFVQFTLQVVTQISYLPGATNAAALASITALSFGLNMMPAYLDFKSRSTPETIEPEYYGLEPVKSDNDESSEDPQVEEP